MSVSAIKEAVVVDDIHARLAKLLIPFPPESIGKLPKGGVMLDYVGHAAITKRLLEVDPEWSWCPLALDERGLPALDRDENLWIKLTICGVTRLGVGDGKNMKERIGDALRNAGMRFGLALDLWTKQDISDTTAAAAAEVNWFKENGWEGQEFHDAFMAKVKEQGPAIGDEFKAWWKEQGLKWPLTGEQATTVGFYLHEHNPERPFAEATS